MCRKAVRRLKEIVCYEHTNIRTTLQGWCALQLLQVRILRNSQVSGLTRGFLLCIAIFQTRGFDRFDFPSA